MIHDEVCTYEVAKLAKEKGFPQDPDKNDHSQMYSWDGLRNIHSLGVWAVWYMEEYDHDNLYAAPTQSLLQRWLREEKDVQIIITPSLDELGTWRWGHYGWVIYIYNEYQPIYYSRFNRDNFCTYEKGLEDALKYALKNLV